MTKDEFRKSIDHCELCGCRRSLELHHIVPLTCGGPDNEENWIMVCVNCHARLTPRRILQRIGIDRRKEDDRVRKFFPVFRLLQFCIDQITEAFPDDEFYAELKRDLRRFMYEYEKEAQ